MTLIRVLGLGCPRCERLERRTLDAAHRLGLDYTFEKVTDIARIIETGAAVPALIVDGRVLAAGTVPTVEAIERLLADAARVVAPDRN